MAKKKSKQATQRPVKKGRKKRAQRKALPTIVTIIRFRCVGGTCTVRPNKRPNIGRGAVFLIAEHTDVTIDFLDKGSPFVKKTDPITIASGDSALHFVDSDADGGYKFKAKACDACDEIPGRVPPEMIVP